MSVRCAPISHSTFILEAWHYPGWLTFHFHLKLEESFCSSILIIVHKHENCTIVHNVHRALVTNICAYIDEVRTKPR